jgi:hypothetical protein
MSAGAQMFANITVGGGLLHVNMYRLYFPPSVGSPTRGTPPVPGTVSISTSTFAILAPRKTYSSVDFIYFLLFFTRNIRRFMRRVSRGEYYGTIIFSEKLLNSVLNSKNRTGTVRGYDPIKDTILLYGWLQVLVTIIILGGSEAVRGVYPPCGEGVEGGPRRGSPPFQEEGGPKGRWRAR